MPQIPFVLAIEELPDLDCEAALFDARTGPHDLSSGDDQILISLIIYA